MIYMCVIIIPLHFILLLKTSTDSQIKYFLMIHNQLYHLLKLTAGYPAMLKASNFFVHGCERSLLISQIRFWLRFMVYCLKKYQKFVRYTKFTHKEKVCNDPDLRLFDQGQIIMTFCVGSIRF